MSRENVETIRSATEALQSREALALIASGDVDLELLDPEIEWDVSGLAELMPSDSAEVYRGHEGVRAYWRQWLEAWRDVQPEILDVRGAGDEVVVLMHNSRFWGWHRGILTELPPYGIVFTFRHGKVVRMRAFPDHESALKSVGLEEKALSQANVEAVLEAMSAFSSGDIDAAIPLYASDVVMYAVPEWPDEPVWRGYDGLRKISAVWTGGFDDVVWDVQEIRDLGERILVRADLTGRIKDSGPPLRQSYGIVVSDFRSGTIGQIRFFLTWQEALNAVGLAG